MISTAGDAAASSARCSTDGGGVAAVTHRLWAWTTKPDLTPLTARTLAAFAAFPASVWFLVVLQSRWSAFRYPMETIAIGLSFTALGVLRPVAP